jgi:DNA invertase Pin-like site-specific DNA recombinase
LTHPDNGHTGTNFERPGVQELLELVRQSKVDCILVKDFSRFGRNSIETGYFIERVFPLFRTRFIAVSDGFDSNDYKEDTGGMEIAFKYLMHEYYSLDLSKKEKSAKYTKFRSGEYQSKVCLYGYRKGASGRMEIDEEAAVAVRLIFETARTMRVTTDIVTVLRDNGIVPPGEYRKANGNGFHDVSRSMGIWQRSSVLRILDDERYTGMYIIGKREVVEVGSNRVRMKDESEWVKIPNHHTAIISKELYDEVQAKMRRFKCPKNPREYTLRSKVACGCCRHAMQIIPRKTRRAFGCRYTLAAETAECHRLEIGEQELENLLYEVISKQAQVIMDAGSLGDVNGAELRTEQQAEYERLIEKQRDRKRTLYERYVLREIDAAAFKAEKAMADTELDRMTRALNTLKAETAVKSAAIAAENELRNTAQTALAESKLTRPLVDLLIDKVYIYPGDHVEIEWKIADFAKNDKECAENVE